MRLRFYIVFTAGVFQHYSRISKNFRVYNLSKFTTYLAAAFDKPYPQLHKEGANHKFQLLTSEYPYPRVPMLVFF